MKIHRSPIIRFTLRVVLALLAGLLSLPDAGRTSAQIVDPRFGIGAAYEAPQAAVETGAGWELIWFHWDAFQPTGPGDWNPGIVPDELLENARSARREVVGVLQSTPDWATEGEPGSGEPIGLYLPSSDPGNLWAMYVRQVVGYYGARGVNRWVIWDSPDIPPGTLGYTWSGSLGDYYQLVKVAYEVAKEANPAAQIHLGAITFHDATWFGRFLDTVLADPDAPANNYYFDVATVSVFFVTERASTLVANQYYLMSQSGIDPLKPVWVNQVEARPGVDPGFYPEDVSFVAHPNVTLEQQASFILQSFALGFAAGAERIGVARLSTAGVVEEDATASGLVRADRTPRPAFYAYQVVTEEFAGFVYARREPDVLADYVRLTFPDKVTHVAWARSPETATLVIPARSTEATLIDQWGNRVTVRPEGREYRVVLEGALCNDPVERCMIGGPVWLLVEEGLEAALSETPPRAQYELGGEPPTPNPNTFMTATSEAILSAPTPTATPEPVTATPVVEATPEAEVAVLPSPEPAEEAAESTPTEGEPPQTQAEGLSPTPLPTPVVSDIEPPPRGLAAILPFLLVGLGALVIGSGLGYFLNHWLAARRSRETTLPPTDRLDKGQPDSYSEEE